MATQAISPLKLVGTAIYLLVWPALIFALAGDWRWPEGWVFGAWFVVMCATCIAWLYRKDPELLAERYRRPGSGGQKAWDRAVVYAIVAGFIAWIVVMPLDAKRFEWTPRLPAWLEGCGATMLALSFFLLFRSFTDNTFLSPLVRIQTERKQHVVSTGVYGFVRHPMYLGAILMFIGAPLLLGSIGGLLIAFAMSVLLAARIVGEEKMLASELEGYEAYRRSVRYRLFPFIW
jgi:protein-S-isoprenylcysteine O-methyltransferase Ste14